MQKAPGSNPSKLIVLDELSRYTMEQSGRGAAW